MLGGTGQRSHLIKPSQGHCAVCRIPGGAAVPQTLGFLAGLCGIMRWSPPAAPSWALLLWLLALLQPPGLGEACSCAPAHPQLHVCHSALGESEASRSLAGLGRGVME